MPVVPSIKLWSSKKQFQDYYVPTNYVLIFLPELQLFLPRQINAWYPITATFISFSFSTPTHFKVRYSETKTVSHNSRQDMTHSKGVLLRIIRNRNYIVSLHPGIEIYREEHFLTWKTEKNSWQMSNSTSSCFWPPPTNLYAGKIQLFW